MSNTKMLMSPYRWMCHSWGQVVEGDLVLLDQTMFGSHYIHVGRRRQEQLLLTAMQRWSRTHDVTGGALLLTLGPTRLTAFLTDRKATQQTTLP